MAGEIFLKNKGSIEFKPEEKFPFLGLQMLGPLEKKCH